MKSGPWITGRMHGIIIQTINCESSLCMTMYSQRSPLRPRPPSAAATTSCKAVDCCTPNKAHRPIGALILWTRRCMHDAGAQQPARKLRISDTHKHPL